MLETMIEAAHEIAKRSGIDLLFLITKEDVDEDAFSFEILQAPKSYATILESLVYHTDDSDITIFEKYLQTYRISDYISTLTYFKSMEIKKAVVVVYTEPLKGIFILEPEKSNFMKILKECAERVDPTALRALLTVALNIAYKGREGKKIGTAFVMGDVEDVLSRSKQLIINPFQCQDEKLRDIKNPEIWESVMEFAQMDGVFVLDEKGIIVSAGRYIEVPATETVKTKPGLGGRHLACASITRETKAIAIVVSESGGDITLYKDGIEVLRIPSIFY